MNVPRSILPARRRIEIGIVVALGSLAALTMPPTLRAAPPAVTNCANSGTGSLRAAIASTLTHSGDTVDLSTLSCPHIDLTTALTISQATLTIAGSGRDDLLITAGYRDRVVMHTGTGTLYVKDLTIAEGYAGSDGGCVHSNGSVTLNRAVVSGCIARSSAANRSERGGGLFTAGSLRLYDTVVRDNLVGSVNSQDPRGGGAFVLGDFTSHNSTLGGNASLGSRTSIGGGGGALVAGTTSLFDSTIEGNSAIYGGGLLVGGASIGGGPSSVSIESSTISGNRAVFAGSGVLARSIAVNISHSTIVDNTVTDSHLSHATSGALTQIDGVLDLKSSVVSGNLLLDVVAPSDIVALNNGVVVGTDDNFVSTANVPIPGGVRSGCPRLGPLADNGRLAKTHLVLAGSPLIDAGNADSTLLLDQRGANRHVRAVDIGSVERQDGEIDDRLFASAFEPVCDI
jgi:hypothetical protein